MSIASSNATWSRRLVQACIEAGVAHAFLSPGSRNTPLMLALNRSGIGTTIVVDERSAGFVALGYIRSARRPAALVCTSGSAPFHYGPAIAEADASSLPLLVLSADRPARLRACGAMQTSLQGNLFPELLRARVDLAAPSHGEESLEPIYQALQHLSGAYPGPVNLNVQFDEPLWEVEAEEAFGLTLGNLPAYEPAPRYAQAGVVPTDFFSPSRRGLITVGPSAYGAFKHEPDIERVLRDLSTQLGWPILSEFHSGMRCPHANMLRFPDLSARLIAKTRPEEAQSILHVGLLPTSKNIQRLLESAHQVLHLDPRPGRRLPLDENLDTFRASPACLMDCVPAQSKSQNEDWLKAWLEIDDQVHSHLENKSWDTLFEPSVARKLFANLESDGSLVVANSMPIRQTDVWLGWNETERLTSVARGVSGIDGTLSSAIGISIAQRRPVWVFLGDLAYLHDANALALARQMGIDLRVVVSDNRGGGIFRRLPIAQHPDAFESHFITPQDRVDLREIAAGYGAQSREVMAYSELQETFDWMRGCEGPTVVVVKTDSVADVDEERRIVAALEEVIR